MKRALFFLSALSLLLAPLGAAPARADGNEVCTERHQATVEICLKNHDPIIRGMCMKIAAKHLADCLKDVRESK